MKHITREKTVLYLQTGVIAAALVGLMVWLGRSLVGTIGTGLFVLMLVVAWSMLGRTSPLTTLRNAYPVTSRNAPELYRVVSELAGRAGLPHPPRVYYVPSRVMNAATVGNRNDSALILTSALVQALGVREITAVLAHEISHIRNNDLSFFTFSELVTQMTMIMSRVGWFLILVQLPLVLATGYGFPISFIILLMLAPLVAVALQSMLSRTREYNADLTAAELTGDPEGLAAALYRLDYPRRRAVSILLPVPAEEPSRLFRTHPPTPERIRRLMALRR